MLTFSRRSSAQATPNIIMYHPQNTASQSSSISSISTSLSFYGASIAPFQPPYELGEQYATIHMLSYDPSAPSTQLHTLPLRLPQSKTYYVEGGRRDQRSVHIHIYILVTGLTPATAVATGINPTMRGAGKWQTDLGYREIPLSHTHHLCKLGSLYTQFCRYFWWAETSTHSTTF